jgi:2-keto-3-deoxy-L-fuconate dehydrogenase
VVAAGEQASGPGAFAGRRAIVTGGLSGIGAATTALLRSRGAVAVLDRGPEADATVDVREAASVEAAVAAAAERLGGAADVLVASAGIYRIAPFLALEPGEWDDAAVPLRRLGTAAEVAATIAFLASDEAAYITGAALPIDGGSTLL